MNQKIKTCALIVLTMTSLSVLPAFASPKNGASKVRSVVPSLPTLASKGAILTPSSKAINSLANTQTIPLIPSVNDEPAQSYSQSSGRSLRLHVGESEVLEFSKVTTTAVGDPTVADVAPLSTKRILISAKGAGRTTVFVYDNDIKKTIIVTVLPSENLSIVAVKIEEQIGIPTVTVRAVNDTIFLEGTVPTTSASNLAESIAKAYAPKVVNMLVIGQTLHEPSNAEKYADLLNQNLGNSGITAKAFDEKTIILTGKYASPTGTIATPKDPTVITDARPLAQQAADDPLQQLLKSLPQDLKIINLVNFEREKAKQVLVQAKVVDINRTGAKSFGLDWGQADYKRDQNGNIVLTVLPQPITLVQTPTGTISSIAGGGPLKRFQPLTAQLSALITENKARVLSQPKLLVLDGNEGSMLVGGEIPIPVLQSGSGSGITILYKQYGIKLLVCPTVVGDDTIQLTVTPEVSDLDYAHAVTINGYTIPGLVVRRASSTLQLKDKQTLVISGLYSNGTSKQVKRIPYLSNIPVLGEFFKSTSTSKEERELMIILEAEVITPETLGVTPPTSGSLENMDIHKPYVPRKEFDQDFPDLQNGIHHVDPEKPKDVISLPSKDSGK